MIGTLAATTVTWLAVTFATKPEPMSTLTAFYKLARPAGPGWGPVREALAAQGDASLSTPLPPAIAVRFRDWALGVLLIDCTLFGVGKVILHEVPLGLGLLAAAGVAGALLWRDLRRAQIT